jgi:hypothetical protein
LIVPLHGYRNSKEIKRLIDKNIAEKADQMIYGSIDNYEKLQYCRGEISSLSQLKEDLSELLRDEDDKN